MSKSFHLISRPVDNFDGSILQSVTILVGVTKTPKSFLYNNNNLKEGALVGNPVATWPTGWRADLIKEPAIGCSGPEGARSFCLKSSVPTGTRVPFGQDL